MGVRISLPSFCNTYILRATAQASPSELQSSRYLLSAIASIAQLAEHALRKRTVVGSIPTGGSLFESLAEQRKDKECPPFCRSKMIPHDFYEVIPAIAQLVEHLTVEFCSNQMVPGSIPGGRILSNFLNSWNVRQRNFQPEMHEVKTCSCPLGLMDKASDL